MSGHKVIVSCVFFFFGEQMSPEMEYFNLFFLTKLEKFKLCKKKLVRANMQSEFCSNKSSTVQYS